MKENYETYLFIFGLGLIIGIMFTVFSIEFDLMDEYVTTEKCQKITLNQSTLAYQTGMFDVINYTQVTGNILYLSQNGTLNEININDQCKIQAQVNSQEVINKNGTK